MFVRLFFSQIGHLLTNSNAPSLINLPGKSLLTFLSRLSRLLPRFTPPSTFLTLFPLSAKDSKKKEIEHYTEK
jgi:hypothetical protein